MKTEDEIREMRARIEERRKRMAETRQQSDALHAEAEIGALDWVLGRLGDDDLGPSGHEWFAD